MTHHLKNKQTKKLNGGPKTPRFISKPRFAASPPHNWERRRAGPGVPSAGGRRLAPAPPLALPGPTSCRPAGAAGKSWRAGGRGPGHCACPVARPAAGRSKVFFFFLAARAGPLRPGSGRPGELPASYSGILPPSLYRAVPGRRGGSLGLRVPRGPGLGERGRGRAAVSPWHVTVRGAPGSHLPLGPRSAGSREGPESWQDGSRELGSPPRPHTGLQPLPRTCLRPARGRWNPGSWP